MVDFTDLAAGVTASAANLLGELVTVVSADGLTTIEDIGAVIERDVNLETDAGTVLRGQTVVSFNKPDLGALALVEKVTVQAVDKTYTVRSIQDEDQWMISAVLV